MSNTTPTQISTLFSSTPPHSLHHAYLLVGDRAVARAAVEGLLTDVLKIEIQGNPDVRRFDTEVYNIEDARNLKDAHSIKSLGEKSFFIISFDSIGWESQNVLLKVFEEPSAGTHFFVLAPSLKGLLPTLLSRFSIIRLPRETPDTTFAAKFLKSSPPARLKLIKSIVENKDKAAALTFLNEMEYLFSAELREGAERRERADASVITADATHSRRAEIVRTLEEILSARNFLQTRSPSVKMLLENLALVLPTL